MNYDPPIGICSTHPHNFLIQIMLETGLVGLIFYLSAIIFVVLKLFEAYLLKNTSVWKNCFLTISLGLIVNFSHSFLVEIFLTTGYPLQIIIMLVFTCFHIKSF